MNLSKFDNKIFQLLKILLAAPLALPLFVSSSFLFPYTSVKAFFFRIIIEIAAVFYLYLYLKHPFKLSLRGYASWRRRSNPVIEQPPAPGGVARDRHVFRCCGILAMTTVVVFFLFVSFLSALFGSNFYHSFWGDLERMSGVWNLAHFAVWFFMLVFIPPFLKGGEGGFEIFQKNNIFFHQLLQFSVIVASTVSFLAILQKFTSLGLLLPQAGRVFSTIGNPAFLGAYLLFNIFFAGYLVFVSAGKTRWLWAVGGLLLAVGLLLTGTRGAMLGLAAGAVIFLALTILSPFLKNSGEGGLNKFKKWPVIFLAAIVLFAGALFFARHTAFVQGNDFLSRLASISSGDTSTQSRLILWQDAWRVWQTRPILGFGPENFETAVSPYLSPRLADYEAYGFDRAHNFIFDYGVTAGWLGLLAYLGIFAAAGWSLIKTIKSNYYFSIIFLSLLAAYLIQNLFVFDTFVSYLMLFFTLAILGSMSLRGAERRSNPADGGKTTGSPRPFGARDDKIVFYKKIILSIFAVFIIFSLYSFNLQPLYASYLANQILISPPEALGKTASINLANILSLQTFASPEIIYQITLDYLDKINQAPQLTQDENIYKILSDGLAANISRSPGQSKNYIALAWLNLYFSGRSKERVGTAIDLGQKALALSPAKKDAYLILAAGYSMNGQPDKALEIVSQADKIGGKIGQDVREYWDKIK